MRVKGVPPITRGAMSTTNTGFTADDRTDERFGAFCERASRAVAALVVFVGLLNAYFWIFDRAMILRMSPHQVVISPGAALAFVLSGMSLWMGQAGNGGRFGRLAADACAILAAAVGFLVLAEYASGRDLITGPLFGSGVLEGGGRLDVRMAPQAALIFLLAGTSMVLGRHRLGGVVPACMALASGLVGLLGVMGYAYYAEELIRFGPSKYIAFQAALFSVFLAIGILLGMKDRGPVGFLSLDRPGSIMARVLLPAVVFVPVLVGLFRVWGEYLGYFRAGVGISLMVLFSVAALAALVVRDALLLNRSDRERERANRVKERQKKMLDETAGILGRVFSNIHLKIAYLDPRFNFLKVNQAYADAAGHPPGYFVGRNHFDLYPDEENERIFRRVVETGESFSVTSKAFEYPDQPERGTTYWDWSLQPVKETDGSVSGLVLSLLDVTDRIRAEKSLREQEELAIQRERMATLGQMAAGIAHEVRNPLSGLNIYLSAAGNACMEGKTLDPETREMVAQAIVSAKAASMKIGEVIRRVMDFVKPGPIVMKRVDVNEAVREALGMVSPTLRQSGIRIDTALSDDLPACIADLRLIEQLVMNLVNNAAQAAARRRGG